MDRVWLIDSRGIAKKVINASLPAEDQIKDYGATRQCPNCLSLIDNSDVGYEWPGFPVGVKFEPSDVELLGHLAAKRGEGSLEPHVYIDEFIPSLEGDEGICYTHPENLPGAKKDGSSVHFFYRTKKAYASGQRKRRRIQERTNIGNVRWHKTGKTKAVMENGVQKGFKKIMVLYANSKRGSKPEKCNWVMHQYHLGTDEDEKDGEFVVSKIFYQPQKETEKNEACLVAQEIPTTPGTGASDVTWLEKTPYSDCVPDYVFMKETVEEGENLKDLSHASYDSCLKDEMEYARSNWGPGAVDLISRDNTLSCSETVHSLDDDDDLRPRVASLADASGVHERDNNKCCGIAELANLDFDTPPDFDPNASPSSPCYLFIFVHLNCIELG
ncbi:hypothetical protein ACS0TY_006700 [Phlomoides rotata]